MRHAYIYKITNTKNNKCYVGFTENPDVRWLEHQTCENYETMPLHKAMRDEGKQHFKFEVLYKSPNIEHTLFVMEPYFIGLHNSHSSQSGYNVNYGGDHPYIKRDGYSILLLDSNSSLVDGEHYDVKPLVAKKTSRKNDLDELTNILERIALKNPSKFVESALTVLHTIEEKTKRAPFDTNDKTLRPISTTPPKTQKERGLDLIKKIQNDGRSAIGKWYIAFGDHILSFRDRKAFFRHAETQMNLSATKMNNIAASLNRSRQRLSLELLQKHHHRGIFVVCVEEHLLFDVPFNRTRRKKFHPPKPPKSVSVSYRKG